MVYGYKGEFNVQEKKCIVTDGAQGLSRGMTEGLLKNGVGMVLMSLQEEKPKQTVEKYHGKGYKAHDVASDLSRKAELDRTLDEVIELLGGELDATIPAVGIQRRYEPWRFPEEMWSLMINVDLSYMWFMCQRATQVMWDKSIVGRIINVGSMNSFFGETTVPMYSAAKGVVTQLSKSIASDCAGYSICCNVITPGHTDTETCANMSQERKDGCARRTVASRRGRPEDLGGPVLLLASSASDYLDGVVIPINGGSLVKS